MPAAIARCTAALGSQHSVAYLADLQQRRLVSLTEIALRPGDRLLMYTDGVTEARAGDGGEFGLEQFARCIIGAMAAGEPAPEALRRLIHSILDSPTSRLRDDATILMFEWTPPPR